MTSVVFTGEIFPEGDRYVGLCRELDVSSFGDPGLFTLQCESWLN